MIRSLLKGIWVYSVFNLEALMQVYTFFDSILSALMRVSINLYGNLPALMQVYTFFDSILSALMPVSIYLYGSLPGLMRLYINTHSLPICIVTGIAITNFYLFKFFSIWF